MSATWSTVQATLAVLSLVIFVLTNLGFTQHRDDTVVAPSDGCAKCSGVFSVRHCEAWCTGGLALFSSAQESGVPSGPQVARAVAEA